MVNYTPPEHDAVRAQRRARLLLDRYGSLDPVGLLEKLLQVEFPGRIAITSSFGAEAAALLDLVAQVDRSIPVIFVDTDALFDETHDYVRELVGRLGFSDLRIVRPSRQALAHADQLWETDANRCCDLRKVLPLADAVRPFEALIDGRKRLHGGERSALPLIQADLSGKIKISPLANWSAEDVERAFVTRNLPRHPLVAQGYRSIGCWPCTRPVEKGEAPRAGRWAGSAKTECGIHSQFKEGLS